MYGDCWVDDQGREKLIEGIGWTGWDLKGRDKKQ